LRELTEEDVKELGLQAIVDRRVRKHLRRLGHDRGREGSRLSSAAQPPQSPQAPPAAVMVEAIPENADKMNAPVQHMVFGDADMYFGGLEAIILPQMLQNSIEEECTLNDGGKWAEGYYYVTTDASVETPIPEKNVVRDQGHGGYTLHQYCEMKAARDANLNEADVVVLRLYTGPLYRPWNNALRSMLKDKTGVIMWATCISVLCSAVIKLMKTAPRKTVYRGLDESNGWELPPAFLHPKEDDLAGGVELGFSSTTEKFETAVRYSGGKGRKGTILKLEFDMASRGASIQFLSQYPQEKEWLWPPCTNLTCSSETVGYEGAKTIVHVGDLLRQFS
jgi:hypothetical protein